MRSIEPGCQCLVEIFGYFLFKSDIGNFGKPAAPALTYNDGNGSLSSNVSYADYRVAALDHDRGIGGAKNAGGLQNSLAKPSSIGPHFWRSFLLPAIPLRFGPRHFMLPLEEPSLDIDVQ